MEEEEPLPPPPPDPKLETQPELKSYVQQRPQPNPIPAPKKDSHTNPKPQPQKESLPKPTPEPKETAVSEDDLPPPPPDPKSEIEKEAHPTVQQKPKAEAKPAPKKDSKQDYHKNLPATKEELMPPPKPKTAPHFQTKKHFKPQPKPSPKTQETSLVLIAFVASGAVIATLCFVGLMFYFMVMPSYSISSKAEPVLAETYPTEPEQLTPAESTPEQPSPTEPVTESSPNACELEAGFSCEGYMVVGGPSGSLNLSVTNRMDEIEISRMDVKDVSGATICSWKGREIVSTGSATTLKANDCNIPATSQKQEFGLSINYINQITLMNYTAAGKIITRVK